MWDRSSNLQHLPRVSQTLNPGYGLRHLVITIKNYANSE